MRFSVCIVKRKLPLEDLRGVEAPQAKARLEEATPPGREAKLPGFQIPPLQPASAGTALLYIRMSYEGVRYGTWKILQ